MASSVRRRRDASGRRRLGLVALALTLLLGLAAGAHHLSERSLLRHQQEVEAELHREVSLRLDVHAQLVEHLVDHVDTLHALMAEAFGASSGSNEEVTAFLARQLRTLGLEERNGIFQVAVIGPDGWLAWSSVPSVTPMDLSDREHFRIHAEGARGPFISEPLIGRASGRRTKQFTRPILDQEGGFRGVTVVSVDPELISRDLALVPMREGGRVLLVRTNGQILASSNRNDGWAGRRMGDADLRRILTKREGIGLLEDSVAEGPHIAAWRHVPDWPVLVVHSLPQEVAVTQARERANSERLVIVGAMLALWGMAVAAMMAFHASSAREAARYAEKARMETDRILDALPGAVYHLGIGLDGTVGWQAAAPAIATLLALGPERPPGGADPFEGILDAEGEATRADFVQRLLQTREAITEYNVIPPGGPLRRVREHARVFADASGEGLQIVGQLTDVTAQRDLEARLMIASRMNTLGDLASGIAHEVNQPAAAIALGADLALLGLERLPPPDAEPLRQRLEEVAQQAIRLREVIAHFRAFTKPDQDRGPLTLQRLDVAVAGVRRIVEGMLNGSGVTLRVQLPADLPPVRCRLIPLEQVFANLIVNARDAVAASPQASRVIELSGWFDAERDAVVVTVRDHGPGFPDHVLPHVFEPFFTTKGPDQGTGLGLSIVHATMAGFGGSVAVRNHPLGGAEVTLVFPQSPAPGTGAPGAHPEDALHG